MHELSIAQSIVDIVTRHLPAGGRTSVKSVRLKLGDMSGVVAESLEFCFSAAAAGTPLAGAALNITRVPFTLQCDTCGATSGNDTGIAQCPRCGSTATRVTGGTELQVMDIEVDD